MQRETVLGQHAAAPGTAVKTHVDGNGLLHNYIQPPGPELLHHPVFGMIEHVRSHRSSADITGNISGMFHGAVVGFAQIQDLPGHFVLGIQAHGEGQCSQQGEE